MRQPAQKVDDTLTWKQEVNRRVAEHNGRKSQAATSRTVPAEGHVAGSAAAKAAARVAARYAKAPSYSEMLAAEARAAVRAAEAASMAAIQAQAAAESVLAGLEAASSATQSTPSWEPEFFAPEPAQPVPVEPFRSVSRPAVQATASPARQALTRESIEIRYDDDLPVRDSAPAVSHASHASHGNQEAGIFETSQETQWHPEPGFGSPLETQGFEVVEPAQPIHANLIEFPRELVATRKIRPRRAEGPYAESAASLAQLSIFEVDPGTISFEPTASGAAAEAGTAATVDREWPDPGWSGPKWSGMELDEEPLEEIFTPAPAAVSVEIADTASVALPLQTAALNRRLLASVVDLSLITGAFLATAMVATLNGMSLQSLKVIELDTAVALPLIAVLYLAIFLTLGKATPGMKYASLEICTFAGEKSTRAQRLSRMGALLLSIAPIGLGAAWALFDEQRLCWHDRLSGTYIRRA